MNPRVTEILETMAPKSVAPANFTSANNYADVTGSKLDAEGKTRVVFTIYNAHAANSIDWKVLASIDDVVYVEVEAEASLAAETAASWVASATETSYRYFKIQVKSTVGAAHGTVQVRGYAKM
jgi:hypothetical protein